MLQTRHNYPAQPRRLEGIHAGRAIFDQFCRARRAVLLAWLARLGRGPPAAAWLRVMQALSLCLGDLLLHGPRFAQRCGVRHSAPPVSAEAGRITIFHILTHSSLPRVLGEFFPFSHGLAHGARSPGHSSLCMSRGTQW